MQWRRVVATGTYRVADELVVSNRTVSGQPGFWVLTPLVQKQIDDMAQRESLQPGAAKMKLLGDKQPSLEFATPEQIGAAAVFLCSDAAAQIRGIGLPVDGGWTAQ